MSDPNAATAAEPVVETAAPVIDLLDPPRDEVAAAILAACAIAGTVDDGRQILAAARTDTDRSVYGAVVGNELVAVYVLRKISLALELTALAVAEGHRRRGYGRACVKDALRRAGKRALVVETDEDALPFYRACGGKIVSRRRHPSGALRYRLGFHAPVRQPAGSPLTLRRSEGERSKVKTW